MGEVINLRLVRKAKVRSEQDRQAEQNRLKHGRTKAERSIEEHRSETEQRHLDGHKLEPDTSGE